MRIGVLGTAVVGHTIGKKLVALGHEVKMGARTAKNEKAEGGQVTEILTKWFGWRSVIDLGDITSARAPEMVLPLWRRLFSTFKTPNLNIHIVRP